MKRKILAIGFAVLAMIMAILIMLYPLISTWYNERHQSKIHSAYQDKVDKADDSWLVEAKKQAMMYNQALLPGTQAPDFFGQTAIQSAAVTYDQQLNLTGDGIMGYVKIPKLHLTLPIYHGTESETLDRGVGHLLGTSLPVGGSSTHTVLTAHSGMASQKMFSDLPQLQQGDIFFLDVLRETLAYQVDQIEIVLPYDTSHLSIIQDEDHCTLITCTPFGVNTHRLLVRGTRIPYEKAEQIQDEQQKEEPEQNVSSWEMEYIKGICIGFGSVTVMSLPALCIWIKKHRKQNKKEDSP